jgi:hypothetical protein
MGPKKKQRIIVISTILILAIVGGAAFWLTRSDKEKEKLQIQAEMTIAKKKVEMYKSFIAAIEETKKTKVPTKPKYEGYDAFDYNKETEYRSSLDEQERRLGDLQSRLNSAYDR